MSSASEIPVEPIGVFSLRFRVLWHEVEIRTPAHEVLGSLRYLTQSALQSVPVLERMTFDVLPDGEGYVVLEEGAYRGGAPSRRAVLELIYQRVHERAFEHASRTGWVRAHAGLVELSGRRLLIAGVGGAGKTTLLLRLLFDGARVQSDESVLLRGGDAVGFPRPFHLKGGVERHVPEVASYLPNLPVFEDANPIRAFDPRAAGFMWEITPGPVDVVIAVERSGGGESWLERVPTTTVMHDIVQEVFLLHEPKSSVVKEIAAVLRTAPTFRLHLGDPSSASSILGTLALETPLHLATLDGIDP